MSLVAKEVDELIKEIRATKRFKVVSSGKHHKVLDIKGRVVVDENGPLIISKTPSEHRWREMTVNRLIKNGVFKVDPRKAEQRPKDARAENGGKRRSRISDPDVQAAKVAAIHAKAARMAQATAAVRARLEPLVAKAGGWGMGRTTQVTASELGRAAMHWGKESNRTDNFRSEDGAKGSAQSNMKQGGTCSEKALGFWDAFVTEWEQAEDPRRWYFNLVRASKGLPPTEVVAAGGEVVPAESEEKPKPQRRASRVSVVQLPRSKHPLATDTTPGHLALKAVYLMSVGREADEAEVLRTGEAILALETQGGLEERMAR